MKFIYENKHFHDMDFTGGYWLLVTKSGQKKYSFSQAVKG